MVHSLAGLKKTLHRKTKERWSKRSSERDATEWRFSVEA